MSIESESPSGPEAVIADTSSSGLALPQAPPGETGAVKAWQEPVVMPTYLPALPDPNPLFLEKRVYQGSSGRVYPLPVIDRVDTERRDHAWEAVHLENEFLRFMILPQIGGRIHVGYDKTGRYDFFYRQNVIKPALVGLAGPWISGGVEFNWPQHHRPATFMPVEVSIEREEDGSVTVWCSDHDPMSRMKGMHGLCLRPGRACLELKVRLYNRTTDTQTFLWWANVATQVHEKYQSFFPRDVRFVADHAKRAITEFPLSYGSYYGIDYARRAAEGVPPEQQPSQFVPDGSCAPNDLSRYANIPVPTSYMIVGSKGDFAGGYDHQREAGVVYVANHHIAPGKKQWTWGNHDFGYAWDRSLTDGDGPYIELMAGAYTDNQPDFSFLAPEETKTFSQFWYPIREIGVPDLATLDAALRMEREGDRVRVHLITTRELPDSLIQLESKNVSLASHRESLQTQMPTRIEFTVPADVEDIAVSLACAGETLLRYASAEIVPVGQPDVATEPLLPEEVSSNDELYLIGVHLEQYRHATRSPEPYWREVLRRDPGDSRTNCALGRWHMRRGEFAEAEKLLRASIARFTERNPNPYESESYYSLGLVLELQERTSEAYDVFYKATWSAAWRGPGYHRLAEIDSRKTAWTRALDHIERSLRAGADNLNARNLQAMILRRLDRDEDARQIVAATRILDPLDTWSRYLENGRVPEDGQLRLDLAFDLLRAGMLHDAHRVLAAPRAKANDGSAPMVLYVLGLVCASLGHAQESTEAFRQAAAAATDYVFPSRLEEMVALQKAIDSNPQDARARYYLGNLLYDRRRHEEAMECWEAAATLEPGFPTVWRNLGFGYFNVQHNPQKASHAFNRARALAPQDARILYEQDQLRKRVGDRPEDRLADLEAARKLVEKRDDLTVEYAALCNLAGRPDEALHVLLHRRFQPWEGGEGMVLAPFTRAHLMLGQSALVEGDPRSALSHFQACLQPPENLGEAWHLLANRSQIEYWIGLAFEAMNDHIQAREQWERAARRDGDFVQMQILPVSESTFWSGMALKSLGQADMARRTFQKIFDYSVQLELETPKIDYFATSLPAMLLFEEDLKSSQRIQALFLRAQACVGLGMIEQAMEFLKTIEELDGSHTGPSELRAATRTSSRSSPDTRSVTGRILLLVFAALCCLAPKLSGQQLQIELNGNSTGRTFDGLGAVSAGASSRLLIDYPEPQRSQILDYLFKPGYGAALQHLKVEIGADVNSTDGSEPSFMRTPDDHNSARGYEWWLMAEAHKRNPNIILEVLPWGAPGWVGKGDSLYTPKMAGYVADFIEAAQNDYHLKISYAGLWNEKVYDTAYVRELTQQLKTHHLSTRIVFCDEYIGEGAGQWAIADEILKDPSLAADIAVIGVHYPRQNDKITTTDAARKTGKPLWSTEDQPNGGGGPFVSRDWPVGGKILAHLYNQNYLEGSLTSTEIWSPITSYYDNLAAPNSGLMYANTPWSGHYDVQGTIWSTAHTTQFAQPGWQYLDSASGNLPEHGSYVSLRSPDRKNWSVVLETIHAAQPQTVSFTIAGGLADSDLYVWETNDAHTFDRVAVLHPASGKFTFTFDPDSLYSLTTTTGQGKGAAVPPPAKAFPLPYEDKFEQTELGHAPKYLSDQDGAFEVRPCNGRSGKCLEQVITTKPVPWGPLPDPFTMAGDATWTDYRVAADVRFLSGSPAVLMGRIDSADIFQDDKARWPSGYVLSLQPDGAWELSSAQFKKPAAVLKSGSAHLDSSSWHHIELRFHGNRIEALLDGKVLTSVEDSSHAHGMFALGAGWGHVQFDNLAVTGN